MFLFRFLVRSAFEIYRATGIKKMFGQKKTLLTALRQAIFIKNIKNRKNSNQSSKYTKQISINIRYKNFF